MSQDTVESQAAGIFLQAARYIRQYGWQKEGMGEHGRPRCSMGALASAYQPVKWGRQLSGLMYQTLYDELGGISLTQYNSKYNDGEKVAQLYEHVAEKLQLSVVYSKR